MLRHAWVQHYWDDADGQLGWRGPPAIRRERPRDATISETVPARGVRRCRCPMLAKMRIGDHQQHRKVPKSQIQVSVDTRGVG